MRLLAVTAPEGWSRSPDTPAAQEVLSNFIAMNRHGVAGPPCQPDGIAQPHGRMVAEALAQPELRRRRGGVGFDAAPLARAEFTAFLRREAETWREVIARGKIRAD